MSKLEKLLLAGVVVFALLFIGANCYRHQRCKERGGHMRQIGVTHTRHDDGNGGVWYSDDAIWECQTTDGRWIPLD